MKRLTEVDINTPDHFDSIWKQPNLHRFDVARCEAVIKFIKPGDHVLDVGCGLYGFGEYLAKYYLFSESGNCNPAHMGTKISGLDFSPAVKAELAKRCPLLDVTVGNVMQMPYGSNSFHVVGATEVIEHVQHPWAFLHELRRVCKPGGYVVIGTVDPDCEDSIRNKVQYPEHIWQFSKGDFSSFGAALGRERAVWRVGNYDFMYFVK